MAYYLLNENGTDRYLLEDDSGLLLIEEQFGPPGGQQTSTGQGTVAKVLSIALVGLSLAVGQGTVAAQNADGSAGLTGASCTSDTGTVGQAASCVLVGRAATVAQGTVYGTGRSVLQSAQGTAAVELSLGLSGQVVTGEQGIITPNADGTVPLIGSAITGATGSVVTPNSVTLTGSESTAAAGTLTPSTRGDTFAGHSLTSAQGTVTIEANNVTVNITGSESVTALGTLDARPILTGSASTSGSGSVVPSADVPLMGSGITSGQGALGIGQDPDDTYIQSRSGSASASTEVPLTGTALTGAQGTVTVTADTLQPLTGSAATSAAGTTDVETSVLLVGASLIGFQYNVGAPGGASLTSQVITLSQGTVSTTADRTEALTGQSATCATGTVVPNPRIPLSGTVLQSGIGTMDRSGGNMQQALSGAVATLALGSVGVIGQTVAPPGVSNEGCGITSAVAAEQNQPASQTGGEGCFTQSGTAREV